MAAKHVDAKNSGQMIDPEIAGHLTESMEMAPMPEPAPLAMPPVSGNGKNWPDGNGKNRHPKERGISHGRMGQGAAVTAVHRTSRPQMPHSS